VDRLGEGSDLWQGGERDERQEGGWGADIILTEAFVP
jgi:hypothetical protein